MEILALKSFTNNILSYTTPIRYLFTISNHCNPYMIHSITQTKLCEKIWFENSWLMAGDIIMLVYMFLNIDWNGYTCYQCYEFEQITTFPSCNRLPLVILQVWASEILRCDTRNSMKSTEKFVLINSGKVCDFSQSNFM